MLLCVEVIQPIRIRLYALNFVTACSLVVRTSGWHAAFGITSMHQLEELHRKFASCAGLLALSCLPFLQNTWTDATALATSRQDAVNKCAALIDNFWANVPDVH